MMVNRFDSFSSSVTDAIESNKEVNCEVNGDLAYDEALQIALDLSRTSTSRPLSSSSSLSTSHPQGIRHRMERYQDILSPNLVRLLEDSLAVINRNNQRHAANAPAAIVMQSTDDYTGAFTHSLPRQQWLEQLEQLTTTHYVALQIIGPHDTLGGTIRDMQQEVAGHPIMTAIIRAHGKSDRLSFGRNNHYRHPTANDFAPLDPRASILFMACRTGQNLAKRVAALQPRPVFACIDSISDPILTPCCDEHGYGLIAFNIADKMVARRFERQGDSVIESHPCCCCAPQKVTIHHPSKEGRLT